MSPLAMKLEKQLDTLIASLSIYHADIHVVLHIEKSYNTQIIREKIEEKVISH